MRTNSNSSLEHNFCGVIEAAGGHARLILSEYGIKLIDSSGNIIGEYETDDEAIRMNQISDNTGLLLNPIH